MTCAPVSPDSTTSTYRLAGLLVGVVAELVLLGALALAAWGDWQNEHRPPLSFEDGLQGLALFGGVGTAFVIGAAVIIAATRQWWGTALATMLLFVAGFVGFLGFALTSLGRQELSDC